MRLNLFPVLSVFGVFSLVSSTRPSTNELEKSRSNGKSHREGKLIIDTLANLSWWNFPSISIPSNECTADTGTMKGVCVNRKSCTADGGSSLGTCGGGFGTCCLFTKGCDNPSTVTQNGTHLISDPLTTPFCRYTIPKQDGVCQIRLDFITFSIDEGPGVEMSGNCSTDTLWISGASNYGPGNGPLCGDLTGQHMYLDYGINDKIHVDVYLDNIKNKQNWDIRVTMIKCNSDQLAPEGCLQYFMDPSGQIESFNFPNKHQLNNQNYAVCIKPVDGMGQIMYKPCDGLNENFFITGDPAQEFYPESGSNCTTDWVMIFGLDKYCGIGFEPVTATLMPFLFQVKFDEKEFAPPIPPIPPPDGAFDPDLFDNNNVGFCLQYTQRPA